MYQKQIAESKLKLDAFVLVGYREVKVISFHVYYFIHEKQKRNITQL